MQSLKQSKQLFKKGAITEWMTIICNDRLLRAINDVEIFSNKYNILPRPCNVFNMFRMIYPNQVKVVIVAQSPYPGCCPYTKVEYAFGPAFLPSPGCKRTPVTLENVIAEASRDMCKKANKSPNNIILDWIEQGVMLLNSSLTLGTNCPDYLEDHSIVWEEIMRDILHTISTSYDPVFLLVGKDAWKFEDNITSSSSIIKVSHPVSRKDTSTPWMGSGVFSTISNMLLEREMMPIVWI